MSWTFVKASWKGGTKFVVENSAGCRSTIAIRDPAGEEPRHFAPTDAFLASLATCAGANVILLLQDRGIAVKSFTVKAEGTARSIEPRSYEKIHLTFLVSGDVEEGIVRDAIARSVTLLCPIAATIGRALDVTWDLQILQGQKSTSRG